MAKPVIVLYINQPHWSITDFSKAQASYDRKFSDYHVLVVPSERKDPLYLEVHNCKNINAIGLKELKQKIEANMFKTEKHHEIITEQADR